MPADKRKAAIVGLAVASTLVAGNLMIGPTTAKHRGMVYKAVPHPEQDVGWYGSLFSLHSFVSIFFVLYEGHLD
jgi:hypothetical protein